MSLRTSAIIIKGRQSYPEIQSTFHATFNFPSPSRSQCHRIRKSVLFLYTAHSPSPSGRPSSFATDDICTAVMDSVLTNPGIGVRRRSLTMERDYNIQISYKSLHRLITKEMELPLYHYRR